MPLSELTRTRVTPGKPEGRVTISYPNDPREVPWFHPEMQIFKCNPYMDYYEEVYPSLNERGGMKVWKHFEHYKMFVKPPDLCIPIVFDTSSFIAGAPPPYHTIRVYENSLWGLRGYGIDAGNFVATLPSYGPTDGSGLIRDPDGLDKMLEAGVSSMMPEIKSNLSLINSVLELKDFASLGRTLKGARDIQNNLFDSSKPLRDLFKRKSLREFLRASSDLYLQWMFNIAPVLSDVSGIYQALQQVERRINDLITRSGSVRVSHRSFSFREFEDVDSAFAYTIGSYPIVIGTCKTHYRTTNEPTQVHVMMEYNYNYTTYQAEHARLLALLDAFGVNLNPTIIWNAIPWSFVIDWLVGVGQWLDQFKVQHTRPVINIRRALYSVVRKRQTAVAFTCGEWTRPDGSLGGSKQVPAVAISESAYKRKPFMPGLNSLTVSGLTPSEVSLGAALVLSRRRHHRH